MRVPVSLQNILAGIYRFTLILARGNAAVAKGMLTVAFFALAAACNDVLPTAPEPVSNIGLRLDTSVGGATVTTDRLDYAPGDTVTITGAGWLPGETVSFLLNEDPEPTHALYSWTTVASDSGTIFDRSFVPNVSHLGVTFLLTATGVSSGRSATRDFTDGNIKISASAGVIFTLTYAEYAKDGKQDFSSANCSASPAPADVQTSIGPGITGEKTVGIGGTQSVRLEAAANATSGGGEFTGWTNVDGATLVSGTLTDRIICVAGFQGEGNKKLIANYGPAVTPTATAVTRTTGNNPSTFGSALTFTATVTRTSNSTAVTTGDVQFRLGGTDCSTGTVAQAATGVDTNGQVTYSTSALDASLTPYTVRACYLGTGVPPAPAFGASNGTISQTVDKANQTITFVALGGKTFGDAPFTVSATGGASGNPVTFVASDVAQCSSSDTNGSTVTINGVGSCSVTASQAGNTNYNAATPVVRSFDIAQASQTITFTSTAPSAAVVAGPTYTVAATGGNSGNAVTFTSATPTICSVTGATVSFTAVGTCTVNANQAGNTNYAAASQVQQSFSVGKGTATITLANLAFIYDATAKAATATTNPTGLTVNISYAQGATPVTSPTNAGSYGVTATINDANYQGSTTGTLNIAKASQLITFAAPASPAVYNSSFGVAPTASSGLTVAVSVTGVCSLSGSTVTMTSGTGTCTITANQAGDDNYSAAASVAHNVTASKAPSTTTVSALSVQYDGNAHPTTATVAGIGTGVTQDVVWTYSGNCSAAPVNVAETPCTATATYAGDANHLGSNGANTITITKAPSTVTVSALNVQYDGLAHPTTALVAGIGTGVTQDVTWAYSGGNCTAAPVNVAETPCTATATYAGDANHLGSNGANTITITKAPSTVTVSALNVQYDGNAHPTTALVAGIGTGISQTVSWSYSGSCSNEPVDVADTPCTATATYAGDTNHDGSNGANTITITKAPSTVTVSPLTVVYDGAAHPTTALVAGIGTGITQAVTWSYSGACSAAPVNVAETPCTATATYAGDANHLGNNGFNTITINKATIAAAVLSNLVQAYTGSILKPTVTTTPGGVIVTLAFSQDDVPKGTSAGVILVGVYQVVGTITDPNYTGPVASEFFVIYDPNGGFVTGGGWINSPANACYLTAVCQGATGKANFGFVSKYVNGANKTPQLTGNTEFQFHAGNLNFKSTSYEWLVVAGARAQYKGTGTINGGPVSYGFMLTAIDGQVNGGGVDRFRIKITNGGTLVYDNQINLLNLVDDDALLTSSATALAGGSINIKK